MSRLTDVRALREHDRTIAWLERQVGVLTRRIADDAKNLAAFEKQLVGQRSSAEMYRRRLQATQQASVRLRQEMSEAP